MFDAADAPDPDRVYLTYLETCRRLGIEPVPRERALGLIGEWTDGAPGADDALAGRTIAIRRAATAHCVKERTMNTRNAKLFIAALSIGLSFINGSTQARLLTWNFGPTTFNFGETASGYFTLDQATGGLAEWNVRIAAGTNPQIPNITFSNGDSGCIVACARLLESFVPPITALDFRTPTAPDNTMYELVVYVDAPSHDLLFPSLNVLPLLTLPFPTNIQHNLFLPPNTLAFLGGSELARNGSILTQAIPEPATSELLTLGLGALAFLGRWKRRTERAASGSTSRIFAGPVIFQSA
jgi:hypothetical protein